ncbi:hypothetical protein ACYOEI_12050 [Singulisphaera rosea]
MATSGEFGTEAVPGLFRRDDIGELIKAWFWKERVRVLLGVGVLLRLIEYAYDRGLWLDEGSLSGNIVGRTWGELFGPLAAMQLAPPGFLLIESLVSRVFGGSSMAMRLFPLVCGIATLFLIERLSIRILRPGAAWIALGLAVVSDELIYYATEIKQYSSDVMFGLLCYVLALAMDSQPLTVSRALKFGGLGAIIVWFSHPSIFVLAGLGTVAFLSALRRRDRRSGALLALVGGLWILSFAGVYLVSQHQLGYGRGMWAFWNFAFPPLPPHSFYEATWGFWRLLYVFVNPLNFSMPVGSRLSIVPVAGLAVVGMVSLRRRRPKDLARLLLPCLFTLLACYLQKHPFHGRLILFLVPSFLMLIAEGAETVHRWSHRRTIWAVVLLVLFLYPSFDAAQHLLGSRVRDGLNPFGDRRPLSLDPGRFPFW